MTRIDLFKKALVGVRSAMQRFPNTPALQSIEIQLDYLIDLEEGRRTDRRRLADIIIGVLAAREVEDRDAELANLLYEVVEQIDAMKCATRKFLPLRRLFFKD